METHKNILNNRRLINLGKYGSFSFKVHQWFRKSFQLNSNRIKSQQQYKENKILRVEYFDTK
jgi:hypothetical protein